MVISCRTTGCIRSVRGLARRAPNADERQLQFSGGGRALRPWLFLIRSSSEDLLQKIPELFEKAKRIGEQAGVSRQRLDQLIVVFDREGYSAELYRYLDGKDQGAGKRRALFVSWAKY